MTLIKCPKCGQTVLSVATTCPKCHHLLTQNPLQQGAESDLITCRRCEKMIPRTATTCEYCGYPVQRRRRIRYAAWSALGIAALAVGAVVVIQMQSERQSEKSGAMSIPPLPEAPAPVPMTVDTAAPVVDRPAPTPPANAMPDSMRPPPGATIRYATIWGNIRASRDTLSPVIATIRPGTPVLAAELRNGWWAVYVDSVFAGYMAGDLLSREPPGTDTIFRDYR